MKAGSDASICNVCGMVRSSNRPDPCLGMLPGVKFACCGHGEKGGGYIYFESGVTVYFDTESIRRRLGDQVITTDFPADRKRPEPQWRDPEWRRPKKRTAADLQYLNWRATKAAGETS